MNPIRTAKLSGSRWKFRFCRIDEDLNGDCDWDNKVIRIQDYDLKDQLLLDTILHESMHACCPWMRECAVRTTATDLARVLWRLGYRPPEEKDVNKD